VGELEPGRGETIVVVEDEPLLGELLSAILEESATPCWSRIRRRAVSREPHRPDPRRAHRLAHARDDRPELAARIAGSHPETTTLFMSGYAADALAGEPPADPLRRSRSEPASSEPRSGPLG
jgi:hypothetical protein